MTEIPDYIFDTALNRLREGESVVQIANSYPEYQAELAELLSLAHMTMRIPKLYPPLPRKQYRFAAKLQSAPYRFAGWFAFARMAVIPISLVAVLLGGRIVVHATENSLPGDKLYTFKRATEQARLNLSLSEDAAATIHVELAQKRLAEVKKAISTNNQAAETAAITALQEQTEKTFALVPQVAAVNAVTNKDTSLLDNLVAINKEQKSLLSSIETTNETADAAKTALDTTKENDKTIAKLIATVNEQTLIDLPNKISVTGNISSLLNNTLTVERNAFKLDEETIITGTDGSIVAELPKDALRVTVIGTRSDQGLMAKKITVIELKPDVVTATPTPTVKGTVTPTPKPSLTPTPTPTPIPTPTDQASGGYIVEPTDNQYEF